MSKILHSNGCPKCKILKKKLDDAKIEYKEKHDPEFLTNHGFFSFPAMEIDGKAFNFYESVIWIKNQNGDDSHE